MSIVSVTDSFIMLRAHCHKGTTHLPTTSIIRKYELLFLNSLWSRFILICQRKECQAIVTVDEADVEITLSIPTNLESFSQVPVFHGITFTKSPRPPYSTLVGHLPRPLPTIVHGMKSGATRVPWTEGNTGQGYPGQRGTEGRYPVAGERWDRGIRGKSTKLGNFWATVSSVA